MPKGKSTVIQPPKVPRPFSADLSLSVDQLPIVVAQIQKYKKLQESWRERILRWPKSLTRSKLYLQSWVKSVHRHSCSMKGLFSRKKQPLDLYTRKQGRSSSTPGASCSYQRHRGRLHIGFLQNNEYAEFLPQELVPHFKGDTSATQVS